MAPSRWEPGWYPPRSVPRSADGIRARSRQGRIGETWWSQRFVDVLESFDMGARLTRGRRYARQGQVLELVVEPGVVEARVQGSRSTPYRVSVRLLPLSGKDWAQVEEAMASRAVFLAKLLAGEMPPAIEEAFAACRLSLFPASPRDLTTDCTCPDWANPCKHVAATYYLLAEAFDADPFLIFRWRGRDREELLARLRGRPGAPLSGGRGDRDLAPVVDAVPLGACLDAFWSAGPGLAEVHAQPGAVTDPTALLRELDPLAVEVRGHDLAGLLAPAYEMLAVAAERRLSGTAGGEDE